jgi:two-component system chemotaxis response regulator CheB
MNTVTKPPSASAADQRYRVMVVDDSAVIRGFFRRALESDPAIEVVASVGNGRYAIDTLGRTDVDVVVLDIEMPVMDGMAALPGLLAVDPSVKIIMASTLTLANAEISLRALARGAADYIPKPTTTSEIHSAGHFHHELLEKVKALGRARRGLATDPAPASRGRAAPAAKAPAVRQPIVLHAPSLVPPSVLAIGSSTGGPQALLKVIGALGDFSLPILITQHMPATFTGILAEHIAKASGRPAREGADGVAVQPGHVYVAPGDFHMTVEAGSRAPVIRLNQGPPENFCRPSVDPMLRSMATVYGARLLTLILTGMGHDGLDGCRSVVAAGGTLVAQDEASSVVWGMPGTVATAGLCSAVLPLESIAQHVRRLSGRGGA